MKNVIIAVIVFVFSWPVFFGFPIPSDADPNNPFICGGEDREKIMNALNSNPEGLTEGEIQDITGYSYFRVGAELGCLEDDGKIRERDPGVFSTVIYISNEADKK